MDYELLRNEILNGPLATVLAPHVASGNDGEVLRLLSEKTEPAKKRVLISNLVEALSESGTFVGIIDASLDQFHIAHKAARKAVGVIRIAKELGIETVDLQRTDNGDLIAGLVIGGLLTQAQAAALLTLSDDSISRVELLLKRVPAIQEIAQALRG